MTVQSLKYNSRIFEDTQDCSPSDSERGFGKEQVVCTFCCTLLDTWVEGRSSHILPRHYRKARCTQNFFNKIITEVETWRFAYDPETKRQRSEWVGETPPRPKKLKFQRSCIKIMLIIFFDSQGVVHKEFVPEWKTVNAEFYKEVMDRLLKRIHRVRPAAFCSRDFFLLHDDAPAHKAVRVCQFLTKKSYNPLSSSYSPDLSPPDYFLFP